MSVEATGPLTETWMWFRAKGASVSSPRPGDTRGNWAMERVRCASSSLKFAAHAVFGPDLNGGLGEPAQLCTISLPDSPNPVSSSPQECPTGCIPAHCTTLEAAEIVYTLWSLVLLEDSQQREVRAEKLLKWRDHKAHLGCIHHQKNPSHQTVITSKQC